MCVYCQKPGAASGEVSFYTITHNIHHNFTSEETSFSKSVGINVDEVMFRMLEAVLRHDLPPGLQRGRGGGEPPRHLHVLLLGPQQEAGHR